MRQVRTSTWVLAAVFLVTLAAYVLFRPQTTATVGVTPRATPAPGVTATH